MRNKKQESFEKFEDIKNESHILNKSHQISIPKILDKNPKTLNSSLTKGNLNLLSPSRSHSLLVQ